MTDHERQPEARGEISGHRQLHEPAEPITDQLLQVKRTVARRSADTKRDAASGVHLERASARHSGNLLSIHWMTRASGWTQRAAELPSCLRPGWRGITAQLRATTQDGPAPSKDDTHLPGVAALAYQALEQMVVLKKFARKKDHPLCHVIIKRLK